MSTTDCFVIVIAARQQGDIHRVTVAFSHLPPEPVAPASLYMISACTPGRAVSPSFELHRLVSRDGDEAVFESDAGALPLPVPGQSYAFVTWAETGRT